SRPGRDPRGHTVSVAFAVKLTRAADPQAGSDAVSASGIVDWQKITPAFDHAEIIADAVALLGHDLLKKNRVSLFRTVLLKRLYRNSLGYCGSTAARHRTNDVPRG